MRRDGRKLIVSAARAPRSGTAAIAIKAAANSTRMRCPIASLPCNKAGTRAALSQRDRAKATLFAH